MSWLSGKDLEDKIKKNADDETWNAFLGVFSIDTLPEQIHSFPILLIINTQTSNLPGLHWKAVYISKERIGEVFDSFALPVSICLTQWLNRFTRSWHSQSLTIQHPLTATCGAFVVYYILMRIHERSLQNCLRIFSTNLSRNDRIVKEFVKLLK